MVYLFSKDKHFVFNRFNIVESALNKPTFLMALGHFFLEASHFFFSSMLILSKQFWENDQLFMSIYICQVIYIFKGDFVINHSSVGN